MTKITLSVRTESDMLTLASHCFKRLVPSDILYLEGGLGAGKTTFARGVIQAAGHMDSVTSPTYSIIQSYDTTPNIHHLDVYRLHGDDDYLYSGLGDTDTTNSIWLIEWPNKVPNALPKPTYQLNFSLNDGSHTVTLSTEAQNRLNIPLDLFNQNT